MMERIIYLLKIIFLLNVIIKILTFLFFKFKNITGSKLIQKETSDTKLNECSYLTFFVFAIM